MYHFGFILEQTLGHVTHGLNLQNFIARDPDVQVEWGLPAWMREGWAGQIPVYRSNWTLQAGLQTRRLLTRFNHPTRMNALFFHTQVTAMLSTDWLRSVPSVISLDATPRQYDRLGALYHHAIGPSWLEYCKWRLTRSCFRLARHIVTWSEWARSGLVQEYEVPINKITVIPPGVDAQSWARPSLRDPHHEVIRILFVGANLERKGGRMLLDAFRRLRAQIALTPPVNKGLSIELHLVTRDTIPPEPGVFIYQTMQPNSKELKELFYQTDIFCLPTQGDCLPMVLSEAGAAGLPLVSTRLAAIPEIVRQDETGFVVPPGDLEALIAALKRLILDAELRLRLGRAAEQLVRQKYDAERNTVQLLDIMKNVSVMSSERPAIL